MPLQRKTAGMSNNGVKKEFKIEIPIPLSGYMALYGEVEFTVDGYTFLLSTQTSIHPLN